MKELKVEVVLYIPVNDENRDENPVDLAHKKLMEICDTFGCDYNSSCVEAEIREVG